MFRWRLAALLPVTAVVLSGAALAGAAPATSFVTTTQLIGPGGRPAPALYQRWADTMRVPGPPGYVIFRKLCGSPFDAGCMDWTAPYATVGLDGDQPHATLAHELGHVFDMYVLAQLGWRDRFAAIDGRPWQTPASEERFAQTYAACAFNTAIKSTISSSYYAWRLTPAQFSASCALIRDAYAAWLQRGLMPAQPGQPVVAAAR